MQVGLPLILLLGTHLLALPLASSQLPAHAVRRQQQIRDAAMHEP
jgi:hypothetical protein